MIQLLREFPPGHGGVERIAHNLAVARGGIVFSLCRNHSLARDPLPVSYQRCQLRSVPFGKFLLVLPSFTLWQLLASREPLLAHQPCPTVLALSILARVVYPSRSISFYWHAFVQRRSGVSGFLEQIYQQLAFRWLARFSVITTSPVLRDSLIRAGLPRSSVSVLPCSLPAQIETLLVSDRSKRRLTSQGRLIFIGRLDSYKRVDWLLDAFLKTPSARVLEILGDGPDRFRLEKQALLHSRSDQSIRFHGRVSEDQKRILLSNSDLMVLPSNRCNEAFGIVQLEAMASGIPSLAFDLPRSGMHWVSSLPALDWTGCPEDLSLVMEKVLSNDKLFPLLCCQASERFDQMFSQIVWHRQLSVVFQSLHD